MRTILTPQSAPCPCCVCRYLATLSYSARLTWYLFLHIGLDCPCYPVLKNRTIFTRACFQWRSSPGAVHKTPSISLLPLVLVRFPFPFYPQCQASDAGHRSYLEPLRLACRRRNFRTSLPLRSPPFVPCWLSRALLACDLLPSFLFFLSVGR